MPAGGDVAGQGRESRRQFVVGDAGDERPRRRRPSRLCRSGRGRRVGFGAARRVRRGFTNLRRGGRRQALNSIAVPGGLAARPRGGDRRLPGHSSQPRSPGALRCAPPQSAAAFAPPRPRPPPPPPPPPPRPPARERPRPARPPAAAARRRPAPGARGRPRVARVRNVATFVACAGSATNCRHAVSRFASSPGPTFTDAKASIARVERVRSRRRRRGERAKCGRADGGRRRSRPWRRPSGSRRPAASAVRRPRSCSRRRPGRPAARARRARARAARRHPRRDALVQAARQRPGSAGSPADAIAASRSPCRRMAARGCARDPPQLRHVERALHHRRALQQRGPQHAANPRALFPRGRIVVRAGGVRPRAPPLGKRAAPDAIAIVQAAPAPEGCRRESPASAPRRAKR